MTLYQKRGDSALFVATFRRIKVFEKKAGDGFDTTESYSGGIIMEGLKRKGFLNGSEVDKSECRAGLRDYYLREGLRIFLSESYYEYEHF